jgi:DNA repair protein RecO (recombination protein O)
MTAARLDPAYILHQHSYGNSSMLLEAFTASSGRLGLVARGVRRKGSRTRALLEPFQPLLLGWRGRGDLKTLAGVEEAGPRRTPQGRALYAGYYCNELILRLFERESAEATVFAAYERVLAALQGEDIPESALRAFELDLLEALGYAPELRQTADTGEGVVAEREYDFFVDSGPMASTGPEARPASVRVNGASLRALAAREFSDPETLRSARTILRAALEPLLGGKPLKSRSVYRRLYGRDAGARGDRGS